MSSSPALRVVCRATLAAVMLTLTSGCTSLTQSDEIKINKDPPKSLLPEPEPEPSPAPAAAAQALDQARNPAPARPARKAGTG